MHWEKSGILFAVLAGRDHRSILLYELVAITCIFYCKHWQRSRTLSPLSIDRELMYHFFSSQWQKLKSFLLYPTEITYLFCCAHWQKSCILSVVQRSGILSVVTTDRDQYPICCAYRQRSCIDSVMRTVIDQVSYLMAEITYLIYVVPTDIDHVSYILYPSTKIMIHSFVRTDKDHVSYFLYVLTQINCLFCCTQGQRSHICSVLRTDRDHVFFLTYL